ncbi:hypothetical protein RQP46_007763 [Phenoliferia psychrophenolica]
MQSLTPAQLADLIDTFNIFDKDHDGSITASELSRAFEFIGQNVGEIDAAEIIKRYDENGDGKIEFPEFWGTLFEGIKMCDVS